MADAVLFVRWNRPVPGQERTVIELFQGFTNYLKRLQNERKIESFEPCLLTENGGDLNGFCLVRGERKALDELAWNEEWRTWLVRGATVMEGYGVIPGSTGAGVNRDMEIFRKALERG